MTGLEKIIEKVNNESEERCSEIIRKAESDCGKILAEAEEKGRKLIENAKAEAEIQSKKMLEMAKSGAQSKSRQAILSAKVEIINEALEKILENVKNLPAEEYFSLIISKAKENALKGECTAYLSKADAGRVPADFEGRLCDALREAGASCTLSKNYANIESGLVLSYGDIEVNCSFEAIVESKADDLKAKLSQILF